MLIHHHSLANPSILISVVGGCEQANHQKTYASQSTLAKQCFVYCSELSSGIATFVDTAFAVSQSSLIVLLLYIIMSGDWWHYE